MNSNLFSKGSLVKSFVNFRRKAQTILGLHSYSEKNNSHRKRLTMTHSFASMRKEEEADAEISTK